MSVKDQGRLFVFANAGRSGSTFLWNLLKANDAAATILHEDIPVQISRPRQYNRAYDSEDRSEVLGDPVLAEHLRRWKALLHSGDVIETGWTVYHLLPILHQVFADQLRVIVLHRDPWSVALSRANMGNYHPRTWYDDRHEVAPYDRRSIAPEYVDLWPSMNHAEKCLFWWYVVYLEVDEFLQCSPSVPRIEISAPALFRGEATAELSSFLSKPLRAAPDLERNPVQKFMLETFPISNEQESFVRHNRINHYAQTQFGYDFDPLEIERHSEKYRLPAGALPRLRNTLDYWSHRRRVGASLRSLLRRQSDSAAE